MTALHKYTLFEFKFKKFLEGGCLWSLSPTDGSFNITWGCGGGGGGGGGLGGLYNA